MSIPPIPPEVFYSYADADESLLNELEKHLSLLQHEGLITTWHKRRITAGTDWTEALDWHLNIASVILLLISPDFLASNYCYGTEIQRAMQRQDANEARVIPVLLRSVDWQGAPFGKLKALPHNGKAITMWRNRDEAFASVSRGIRAIFEDIQQPTVNTSPTTLPRIWMIPYPRNLMFTGREEVLKRLADTLEVGQLTAVSQPQAISGLGGIGKTQVAVEYAYKHRQDYQAVLWTRADTREALISGYVTIADLLNLPGKNEKDQMIPVKAVMRWLTIHTGWLLILDNADDLTVVREFLPPVFGGHILLTTRAQAMGRLAQRIEVDTMEPDIGAQFLLRRAGLVAHNAPLEGAFSSDSARAKEITEELGGLPLALDQAGAYIEETQCSLTDYQSFYRTRRAEMLKERGGLINDHPEPVATTWSLSFQEVERENFAAAELLRACSFLDPDAIPEEIITEGASELGKALGSTAKDIFDLNEAIRVLKRFSLLRRSLETKMLSMHRLVQAVLKDGMSQKTQQQWAKRIVRAVNYVFPEVKVATWFRCQRCLSQALMCAELIDQYKLVFQEGALLLYRAGHYLHDQALYTQAEQLYLQSLTIQEREEGFEQPHTIDIAYELARLYQDQGQYSKAEALYQQILIVCQQVIGSEHPRIASILNQLAQLAQDRDQYVQAESLYQQALTIREKILGPQHPDTAMSLNNLATLYQDQGQYSQAKILYQRALAIRKEVLGLEHPDTAASFNALASLYHDKGRYVQAELLFKRALAIREKILGPEHPSIAASFNNLAALYGIQGQYAQAELFMMRALSILEKVHGLEHPSTASSLNNLAILYDKQGRYVQAEQLYMSVLTLKEKVLGVEHHSTLETLERYILVLQKVQSVELRALFKTLQLSPIVKEDLPLFKKNIPSHLGSYPELLQQNLFFMCLCLTSNIPVENQLAERLALRLSDIITTSRVLPQRSEALMVLALLLNTTQHTHLASRTLLTLVAQDKLGISVRIQLAQVLYTHTSLGSLERRQARDLIIQLALFPTVPFQIACDALQTFYWHSRHEPEEQQVAMQTLSQLAQQSTTTFKEALGFCLGTLYDDPTEYPQVIQMLVMLTQRSDITFAQRIEAIEGLYRYTEDETKEKCLASQMLFDLMQQTHLSLEHCVLSAQAAYRCSIAGSQEEERAVQRLQELAQLPHISIELAIQVAKTFNRHHSREVEENLQTKQILLKLLRRPDISFKDAILINETLCQTSLPNSGEYQVAKQKLMHIVEQPDTPCQERVLAAEILGKYSSMKSPERQLAIRTLLSLILQPELPVEHVLCIAQVLYKYDAPGLQAAQITRQILAEVTQQFKLSFEQLILIIQFLYEHSFDFSISLFKSRFPKPEERELAKQITEQILQKRELTIDQRLQLVAIPITTFNTVYADKAHAVQMILSIFQGEAARQYLEEQWQIEDNSYSHDQDKVMTSDVTFIIELLKQELLPSRVRDHLYRILRHLFPFYWDTSSLLYKLTIPEADES